MILKGDLGNDRQTQNFHSIRLLVSQTVVTENVPMKDISIFLIVSAITWFLTYRIDYVHDFGYMIHLVDRVANGQLPYRDFSLPRTPLFFFVHGFVYKLFGFYGLKAFHCIQSGLIVSLCLKIK